MLSAQASSISRPATPASHRLRAYTSYDSLGPEFDPPFQSRARRKRVFPMEFEDVGDKPEPGAKHAFKRFASPERFNALPHIGSRNSVRTDGAKRKVSATVPSDRDPEAGLSGVWDTYVEVANKADSTILEGWNRSMDVLLVFTGLFSAVLTTFLIESYHQLIEDPGEMTNVLLAEMIGLMRNESSSPTPSRSPSDSRRTGSVNGLWFAALSCSLSTALTSMLAKQWLQHYQSHDSGSSHQRARSRQVKYMQLQAWHVPAIINCLPLLVHVALLLFFSGLSILLWTVDLGVAIATFAICLLAYGFYLASIILPFIFPGCPYYHPISGYLRVLFPPRKDNGNTGNAPSTSRSYRSLVSGEFCEDEIDALALAWLMSCTNDSHVRNQALHGIATLPFDFSAMHILRDAGAEDLALDAFESCFQRDSTAGMQWELVDPIGAEVFCRAWLGLTWRCDLQWPLGLLDPLWILQDLKSHPDATAVASCVIAKSSLDSMQAQWEVISLLGQSVYGHIRLSSLSQSWLLETMIDSLSRWEMPSVVVEETAVKALPILLQLLCQHEDSPGKSRLRCAAALSLYIITIGPNKTDALHTTEHRCDAYIRLMVQSLSCVVETPQRFRATDRHLNIISRLIARFATALLTPPNDILSSVPYVAKSSISRLFAEGRISLGVVSDDILADALQFIYPPTRLHSSRHSSFVSQLIENIEVSTHPDIVSWSIRCLETVLRTLSPELVDEFVEKNGINVILRATRMSVYSNRLQVDSLRAVCTFVRSSTELYLKHGLASDKHIAKLFESDFFDVLLSVLNSRRDEAYRQSAWWLTEVVRHWIPALTVLCRARPYGKIWHTIISSITDFAETHDIALYKETIISLTSIVNLVGLDNLGDLTLYRPSSLIETLPAQKDLHVKFESS